MSDVSRPVSFAMLQPAVARQRSLAGRLATAMAKRLQPLPGRMLLGFSVVLLTIWATSWAAIYSVGHNERAAAIVTARNTSMMVTAYVSQTLKAGTIVLDSMRALVAHRGIESPEAFRALLDNVEVHNMLKSRIVNMPELDKVAFISADGQVLNFSLSYPPPPIRVSDRDYFIEQMGEKPPATSLSIVVTDRGSGRRTFFLAQRVVSAQGRVLGLVLAAIDADILANFFQRTALGDASAIFLSRADGALLTGVGLRPGAYGQRLSETPAQLLDAGAGYVTNGGSLPTNFPMRSYAAAVQAVDGLPAEVTVVIGDQDIYADWWRSTATILVLSLALCLFIAAVIWEMTTLFSRLLLTSQAAQAANNAKTQFITNMSHELRTPLNGILGMFRMLGSKPIDDESKLFVETGTRSAEHLMAIVNDLLDLSKVEAGCMELERAPFSVREMVQHAVSIVQPVGAERANTIELVIDENVPNRVLGDEARWRQVLLNLLGNAVKFTENGIVAVRVEASSPANGFAAIRFSVADTGIGIPQAVQADIFNKFVQADSSIQRRFGGTGLGLTISRLIVEQLSGCIGFESEPGAGSLFWFEIPGVPVLATPEPSIPAQTAVSGPLRLLSVEDSATNQLVIQHMLSHAGHAYDAAHDGLEALEKAELTSYDAILMDVQMPKMDGIEATRRLRQGRSKNAQTPIIIVTAHAMANDRQKFIDAGADDYLAKPIRPHELKAALQRATQRAGKAASQLAAA